MDFDLQPDYYDAIYTGDLGKIGQKILIDLMIEKGFDISEKHHDCGNENVKQHRWNGSHLKGGTNEY